ncbi:MAG: right-handed parallel beta-helix repeat-containing protein, partial [Deltaproteobacteria bacterium]|nr:right-handed parallel beta-helix repeat-containing protein [Deltaproteobacteria bacterium]
MRIVAIALALAGCGRLGFDATPSVIGDGAGGDGTGSGSGCAEPAATLTIHATDNFYALVATLPAGSVVEVETGMWSNPGGNAHQVWTGTAAAPIIVRPAPGASPKLTTTAGNNVLDLDGTYVTLRGFEFFGGDIGIRLGADDHITLEDLYIHDMLDQGITCNRPGESCTNVTIRGVEIARSGNTQTGSGITLGCSDQSCAASNTLVEGCFIHDLMGTAGSGISKWFGDGNVFRDNVFVRTSGPGIVIQASATTQRDVIERNYMNAIGNNDIQVEGWVTVRNNVLIGGAVDGINIRQQSGSAPTNLEVLHNSIIGAANICIHAIGLTGSPQVLSNNALRCAMGTSLTGVATASANIAAGANDVGVSPNVYPTAGSALVDTGDAAHSVA